MEVMAVAMALVKAVEGAEEVTAATAAVLEPLTRYPTTRAPEMEDPCRALSSAPERAREPEGAVYSTTPAEVAMEVMVAVQEVQPAAAMEVDRAAVRVLMVAVVGVVPLNAELGREEREKEPVAAAG